MILTFSGKTPRIGRDVFIAPTAVVIGDVVIGDGASIWYGTVLRGDMATITVGARSNIQDNCTVHTDLDFPALIGEDVTVGHNAVIHGCTLEPGCLIGIGAIVLNGAVLRAGAVVAAGAVVREGQEVGPRQLVAGVPAQLKTVLDETAAARFRQAAEHYVLLAQAHRGVHPRGQDEHGGG
jgi:carbonic anhydrase/acetyltransferase-like protein (isoleucine patch superfamily)